MNTLSLSTHRRVLESSGFAGLFGDGRGLGPQFSLLATRPEPRAQREMLEHDAQLGLEEVAADINLIRDHPDLERYPVLSELCERLPARLVRMVEHDLETELRLLLAVMVRGDAMRALTQDRLHKRTLALASSRLQPLMLGAEGTCAEEVWAAALDALEHAFADEIGPLLDDTTASSALKSVLQERWAEAQRLYGREQLQTLTVDPSWVRALALRIIRESVGLCGEEAHVREAVWDALTWVMAGKPELPELVSVVAATLISSET